MAFVNLPPNFQDMFGLINDRIAKLETGPNQAMYTADTAQGTASSASAAAASAQSTANTANSTANTANSTANTAYAYATSAQATAASAAAAAANAYSVASTAVQVSANTIVNASNQLTAINGNGITVYSGSSSTSGARVVLNSAGLAGFNSGGTSTFALDSATGNVSLTGTVTSTAGQIGGWSLAAGRLYSGTSEMNASTGNCIFNTGTFSAVNVSGVINTIGNNAINSGGSITANGSATFGSTNLFEFLSSSGNVRVGATYGQAVSGRAMQISSAGLYGTTASTERKKHNIKPHAIDKDTLLQLEPVTFNYIESIDEEQNPEYGFIAEDADRLGLYELVGYDKEGLPDYFAYEKLPIFLLQVIKEQEARIKTLEAQIKP
jgi:hypothetical protein